MYRFRSVDKLIGEKYQELERQQIYFASTDELNDPLEGTRRYFWQGDEIVWTNFFKHYLLCLGHVMLLIQLLPDSYSIQKTDIPIYLSEMKIPTKQYKQRIGTINNTFFSNSIVQSYIQFMIMNPNKIYRDEMFVHLKLLFSYAFQSVLEVDRKSGLLSNVENTKLFQAQQIYPSQPVNLWEGIYEHPDWKNVYKEVMANLYDTLKSLDNELDHNLQDSPKLRSFFEFPQLYLDAVVQLTFPNAYVACFMDNCMNPSIWGTYDDSHTGACLKFKTESEKAPSLTLKKIIGVNGSGFRYEYRSVPLKPMTYSSDLEEIDFFRNLGRLPIPQLLEQWYSDENKRMSACSDDILHQEQEWREQHWRKYERAYLKKLPAWEHEREHRIIIHSALDMYENPKDRALEYKFENLEAIIFGMKTAKEDRAKIIEIVKRKCEESGRTEFDFFEMAYSDQKNDWNLRKLFPVLGN